MFPFFLIVKQTGLLQVVIGRFDNDHLPLLEVIFQNITTALLAREVCQYQQELLELPVKHGGLSLADSVNSAPLLYLVSNKATRVLQEAMVTGDQYNLFDDQAHCSLW